MFNQCYTVCVYNQLVNVSDHNDNPHEAVFSCVFPERVVVAHQNAAENGLFCVLGSESPNDASSRAKRGSSHIPLIRHAERQRGSSVCDLVGWLNVEARGRRRVTTACAYDVTLTSGDADSSLSPSWGRGRLSGDVKHYCLPDSPVFIGKQHQNQQKTMAAKNFALRAGTVFLLAMGVALTCSAKIHRDSKAVAEFKRSTPCPATGRPEKKCKGYVVDHVIALACGGPDLPSNLQYQTIADAKAKDKWETKECRK